MYDNYKIYSDQILGDKHRISGIAIRICKINNTKLIPFGLTNLEEFSNEKKRLEFFDWFLAEVKFIYALSKSNRIVLRINLGELTNPGVLKLLEFLAKENTLPFIDLQIRDSYNFWINEKAHFSFHEKRAFILGKLRSLKMLGFTIIAENVGNGIYSLENINYYICCIDVIQLKVETDQLYEMEPFIKAWENYSSIHDTKLSLEYLKTSITANIDYSAGQSQISKP
ncbi:hypothetical protein ACSMFR_02825 [Listeria aquatica]|uniref:hypothetical protein n=1 Tax=Listeria aquatica TaxID=1494960 RepID=UPI003F6EB245